VKQPKRGVFTFDRIIVRKLRTVCWVILHRLYLSVP